MFHARIQEFSSGGGGGSRSGQPGKKSSDKVFFLFFFLVLSLFYRRQMVNFKEIDHFSRFQRGSNIFQGGGGPTFSREGGVQLLIPYRNPYNLWFSRGGGSGPPVPPSGSALVFWLRNKKINFKLYPYPDAWKREVLHTSIFFKGSDSPTSIFYPLKANICTLEKNGALQRKKSIHAHTHIAQSLSW